MKFQLNPITSDVVITIYVVVTLFYRLKFERDIGASPLLSMVIGASLILIIWSLIKLKILNPNWFGFFQSKKLKP